MEIVFNGRGRNMGPRGMFIFGLVFSLIGLFLLFFAFNAWRSEAAFMKQAQTTMGAVVQLAPVQGRHGVTYAPVIRYLVNGTSYQFQSHSSSNPPAYHLNQYVKVLYNKADPSKGEVNSTFGKWGTAMILGLMGIIFFSVGAFVTYRARKKKRQSA